MKNLVLMIGAVALVAAATVFAPTVEAYGRRAVAKSKSVQSVDGGVVKSKAASRTARDVVSSGTCSGGGGYESIDGSDIAPAAVSARIDVQSPVSSNPGGNVLLRNVPPGSKIIVQPPGTSLQNQTPAEVKPLDIGPSAAIEATVSEAGPPKAWPPLASAVATAGEGLVTKAKVKTH